MHRNPINSAGKLVAMFAQRRQPAVSFVAGIGVFIGLWKWERSTDPEWRQQLSFFEEAGDEITWPLLLSALIDNIEMCVRGISTW